VNYLFNFPISLKVKKYDQLNQILKFYKNIKINQLKKMDNIFNQDPLFNISKLDFFNLSLKPENLEWEKFLEEMLLLRYSSFRFSYLQGNYESMLYFLTLLEGNFL